MKHSLLYIAAGLVAASAAFTACDNDFTYPPVIMPPVTDVDGNIEMAEFKTEYWSALNAPTTVGYTEDGDTLVFTGRVCSSDETGNIYKSIIIQTRDENGEQIAMTFSVNAYDIYQLFGFGQEVAVYASGMQIGPYRNLLQFGSIDGDQMTFMDQTMFQAHVFRNKAPLPEPEKVDTTLTTIAEVLTAKSNPATLCKWQSRLVRFDNVHIVEAGQPFAPEKINRTIEDAAGNKLVLRNSDYASFADKAMPYGTGSIVGILSYYSKDWQLILIDEEGCIGFDNIAPEPVVPETPAGDGTLESPYNVAAVLALYAAGSVPQEASDATEVYVKGIVTKVTDIDTSTYGNATYYIADKAGDTEFMIYRGKNLNGEKFTSKDQLVEGTSVVICGKLINFKGNTPEMAQNNYLVSYTAPTAE